MLRDPTSADTSRVRLRVLTWNIFHGRDFPPNPALFTPRSKLWRVTERDDAHAQVNRDLSDAFADTLEAADWDIALLQECPPRWSRWLARTCAANGHQALTSRNWALPFTSAFAAFNPDLIGSEEGGSNTTLVRSNAIAERRHLVICPYLHPERRVMAFTRLASGICVANLHASTNPELAVPELRHAAATATGWAAGSPLVLGGDFNVRPQRTPGIFEELRERGFSGPTAPDSIDHLLAHGLETSAAPRTWLPEEREVALGGLRLRLSDHAPVEAAFHVR
jgi:endonuclease/exonuclease/phosphatase family metal-dependent hydrolase